MSNIRVVVYDITGKEVMILADKKLNAGEYEITFDARDLPSGVYFYSLIVGGILAGVKKMIC